MLIRAEAGGPAGISAVVRRAPLTPTVVCCHQPVTAPPLAAGAPPPAAGAPRRHRLPVWRRPVMLPRGCRRWRGRPLQWTLLTLLPVLERRGRRRFHWRRPEREREGCFSSSDLSSPAGGWRSGRSALGPWPAPAWRGATNLPTITTLRQRHLLECSDPQRVFLVRRWSRCRSPLAPADDPVPAAGWLGGGGGNCTFRRGPGLLPLR